MSQSTERRRALAFTFGLERLGLLALGAPRVSAALIVFLSVLAWWGVANMKVDDSLSELFRTNTDEFRRYEEIDRRFPSSEYDVLVVVEGKDLLRRPQLEAFRQALVDVQLTDGVAGVVSMLSARGKPDATGYAAPIVPDDLPAGREYENIIDAVRKNEIVAGKFLSADGELALVILALDRATVAEQGTKPVIASIRQIFEQHLSGVGLRAQLTGAPVMQLEIRNAVERDRMLYNGLGFLVGAGIAFLFFRRLSLTLIAALGPAIAILWTLGVIGALDYRLNLFINVLAPLILVSGFSDSMHLVLSIRRDILAGADRLTAARNAVLDVGPACLLTAMNQALAIASFAWADSALVRTFGIAALIAVALSYTAVAVVVPTLAALLIRKETGGRPAERKEHGLAVLGRFCDATARGVMRLPVTFSILGIVAVCTTGLAYMRLEPHYRLADQVPDREQALAATGRLDQKLTGANPVHVMIQWQGRGLYDPATLAVIGEAHRVLESRAGLGNVWSLESLRRWLADAGDPRIETVQKYVKVLPEHLVRRFIDKQETAVLVTGRLPDVDASEILPVVERLDRALDVVRKAHPDYEISVTGLPAIAARSSAKLIGDLNRGLVGDMFVIFIFVGIALRSLLSSVASILPSLLPIFATGALLLATGEGLQFASIIAITVAFSLAIDSTIHFLNRFQLEERRLEPGPDNAPLAVLSTMQHVGPAVVLTTIVLALGLGVTILSDLPSLRLFGRLTAITLLASLVGQLIVLPATIVVFRRVWPLKTPGLDASPANQRGAEPVV